jgi:uncharacterized protein (TIGR02757 family)
MLSPKITDQLEAAVEHYNTPDFITNDPISIPHMFTKKEDIEISGLLAATIAWGKRSMIINNAQRLMQMMGHEPYQFVMNASSKELKSLGSFVHRTFQADDLLFFIEALKNVYAHHASLEDVFHEGYEKEGDIKGAIENFRNVMFKTDHLKRSEKHISSPAKGSAAKRINMYLRWMVRSDNKGVDFGIWKKIPSSVLICPLDVHSGRVAREFGILNRKQDDWKAAIELTESLRVLDPNDPVKYDYALFGIGVNS